MLAFLSKLQILLLRLAVLAGDVLSMAGIGSEGATF